MKKIHLTIVALLAIAAICLTSSRPQKQEGQRYALYAVAFYNLENLFDTLHDEAWEVRNGVRVKVEDKNDYEYLPDGANHWTAYKYKHKQKNMSYALSKLATDKLPLGPAIIGVSEVENRGVLEDLIRQPALKDRGLQIIHEDGPDRRGVECAFLYNPKLFKYDHHKLVPYIYPDNDTTHRTRGFLIATGKIAGEDVHVIVNHWPSRGAVSFFREHAGKQVRVVKDSLLRENPKAKIIIMGDMNDDPDDPSMAKSLGAKRNAKDCGEHDLYNPWWNILRKEGRGTLKYDGRWNLFDQIVFTGNFLGFDGTDLKYSRAEIFQRDFLMQQEGKFKGNPKRTHGSGVWLNGYSDHLPTIVYFRKTVQ